MIEKKEGERVKEWESKNRNDKSDALRGLERGKRKQQQHS